MRHATHKRSNGPCAERDAVHRARGLTPCANVRMHPKRFNAGVQKTKAVFFCVRHFAFSSTEHGHTQTVLFEFPRTHSVAHTHTQAHKHTHRTYRIKNPYEFLYCIAVLVATRRGSNGGGLEPVQSTQSSRSCAQRQRRPL